MSSFVPICRGPWTRYNSFVSPRRALDSHIRPRSLNTSSSPSTHHININNTAVPSLYVAATRQHVGKTSVSLALLSGLQRRLNKVGFMKPVGQQSVSVPNPHTPGQSILVDKDAALIHSYFSLDPQLLDCVSPVLIPAGYTRDYLDGTLVTAPARECIQSAYGRIAATCDLVLCEGTGHTGVGSIVQASNAQVAAWLGSPMVLVVNGGLGRSVDELVLNQALCYQHGVPIAGVIVNQVQHDKYDQTVLYMTKALQHLYGDDIGLLGCIPDRPFLGCPAICDLVHVLDGQLVSGYEHLLRHFRIQSDLHLVACSLEAFLQRLRRQRAVASEAVENNNNNIMNDANEPVHHHRTLPLLNDNRTLYVCHASRTDILLGFLMEAVQHTLEQGDSHTKCESSMVITGCASHPLSAQILEIISALPAAPPLLLSPHGTDEVLKRMYGYTPKLNRHDPRRVATAIQHYEPYINFDLLLERIGCPVPSNKQQQEAVTE